MYIRPVVISKKEANDKTKILNDKQFAERKEYLNNHSIKDTLTLPKKIDK